MAKSKLIEKWEASSRRSWNRHCRPYEVDLETTLKLHAELLLTNFGARNGTLVFTDMDAIWSHRNELSNLGYGYSVLDEPTDKANVVYDRDLFIEMLSEWEWTGDEATRPGWLRPPPTGE